MRRRLPATAGRVRHLPESLLDVSVDARALELRYAALPLSVTSRDGEEDAAAGALGRSARVNLQRTVFARLYRRAPSVESLPWHREQPPALLERAVAQRTTRGRALDLGCGQGVHAVYLAQQGFSVVAVDFVPAALAAARTRAEQAGVKVELRECDVVEYELPSAFDVVLDSGACTICPEERSAPTGTDWTSGSHRGVTTCSSTSCTGRARSGYPRVPDT